MLPASFGADDRARYIGYAERILRNREDAEDAVQTAVIQALTHHIELRDVNSFERWFYTVLRRSALLCLRHRRRLDPLVDHSAHYREQVETRIYTAEVLRALNRLPNGQRECLQLVALAEDVMQIELAERLRLPLAVFKTRLRCARRTLRDRLER
jgi:RNA polymerase sigma-70 factor, ECF subfamily